MKNFKIERDEAHQCWIIRRKDGRPIGCRHEYGFTDHPFDNISISDNVLTELLEYKEVRRASL